MMEQNDVTFEQRYWSRYAARASLLTRTDFTALTFSLLLLKVASFIHAETLLRPANYIRDDHTNVVGSTPVRLQSFAASKSVSY
jgi:hypothetical protein